MSLVLVPRPWFILSLNFYQAQHPHVSSQLKNLFNFNKGLISDICQKPEVSIQNNLTPIRQVQQIRPKKSPIKVSPINSVDQEISVKNEIVEEFEEVDTSSGRSSVLQIQEDDSERAEEMDNGLDFFMPSADLSEKPFSIIFPNIVNGETTKTINEDGDSVIYTNTIEARRAAQRACKFGFSLEDIMTYDSRKYKLGVFALMPGHYSEMKACSLHSQRYNRN